MLSLMFMTLSNIPLVYLSTRQLVYLSTRSLVYFLPLLQYLCIERATLFLW